MHELGEPKAEARVYGRLVAVAAGVGKGRAEPFYAPLAQVRVQWFYAPAQVEKKLLRLGEGVRPLVEKLSVQKVLSVRIERLPRGRAPGHGVTRRPSHRATSRC